MLDKFILPIMEALEPEDQHLAMLNFLHIVQQSHESDMLLKKLSGGERHVDERLQVNISGIKLDNPLILGAGWDKSGIAVKALYSLGFGCIEIGSVPIHPQEGNPLPRHFILAPGVVMNRYGFNTPGLSVIAENIKRYKKDIPIGINIGKNRDVSEEEAPQAFATVAKNLYNYATYFVINVSSPNTPGLRQLQDKEPLTKIVQSIHTEMDKIGKRIPLFVKIAPDLSYQILDDVIYVARENDLAGIIATNTTLDPNIKAKYGEIWRNQAGGLSGDDSNFRQLVLSKIKYIYKHGGKNLSIIGVGGIKDTETAIETIKAGATAIQLVTALDFYGPMLPNVINKGISNLLEKEGVKNIHELIGVDVR